MKYDCDAASNTPAQYQALPVTHHQMEEAPYNSGALAFEEVVALAASMDPGPEVIHMDLRSPSFFHWGEGLVTEAVEGTPLLGPSLRILQIFYCCRFHPTPHESNTSLNCTAFAAPLVS